MGNSVGPTRDKSTVVNNTKFNVLANMSRGSLVFTISDLVYWVRNTIEQRMNIKACPVSPESLLLCLTKYSNIYTRRTGVN